MSGVRAVRRTLARHELRARWRVLLALGVAAGVFAGLTLAVVSLYLRSDSVFDRLVDRTGQADARVGTYNVFNRLQDRDRVRVDLARARADVVSRPDVVDVQEMVAVYVRPVEQAATFFAVWAPTQPWRGIDQPVVVAGRLPSDIAPGEVMINEQRARQDGVGLGSQLTVGIFEAAQVRGNDEGLTEPRAGYRTLTVVGIYRSPDSGTGFNRYIAGPAFAARYAAAAGIGTLQLLRLDPSRADGASLAEQVTRLNNRLVLDYGPGFYSYVDLAVPSETPDPVVGPTLAVLRAGLLGFLAVLGAVGLLVVAQLTRRLDELGHDDLGAVVALGVSRRDLLAARLRAVAPAALLAALLAVAGALLGGFVRPPGALAGFEAEPGWYFVLWPVVAGPVAVAVLVFAAAAVNVLAATRTRPPVLVRNRTPAVRRVRIGPAATLAAALTRSGGSRRTGMRVRATMGSVAAVVALLAAAVVLVDQLASIEANRNRWGWTPDFSVSTSSPELRSSLAADRRVVDADTVVDAPLVVSSGARQVALSGYGRDPIKGQLPYETTSGRTPSANDEIALGAGAARELRVAPGEQVSLEGRAGVERRVTVTGVVVLPTLENEPLGRNALLQLPTLRATARTTGYPNVFVRAVTPDAAAAVRASLPPGTGTLSPVAPPTVRALDRLAGPGRVLLAVLAGALLLLVAGHARQLVRRRGNQLAIAEAIGMPTHRVIGAAAGSVIGAAVLAAAVGLPVGWAAGRVAVAELAPRLGLSPRDAPWGELLLGLVVITAVAGVAAALVIALLRVRGRTSRAGLVLTPRRDAS